MSHPVPLAPATPRVLRAAQPGDLRRRNLSALLSALRGAGPVARAELAAMTGMATGTVTKLTAVLAEVGLVRELAGPSTERSPGRPRVPVDLDPRRFRVVGVHVGLLRTNLSLLDLHGRVVADTKLAHRGHGFDTVMTQAVDGVRELLRVHRGTVLGVGASTGGRVDDNDGRVVEHTVLGWRDAPFRTTLQDALQVPVHVDSSFRALALAELRRGIADHLEHLVYLFVGNVVGAGLVLDGNVYRGARSLAGDLQHLAVGGRSRRPCSCGRHGCLQVVATDITVVEQARSESVIGSGDELEQLIAVARDGNRRAHRLLAGRARHVGTAAGMLIENIDPQVVVVGGGTVDAEEYLDDVREGARTYLQGRRKIDVDAIVRTSVFGAQHPISASSAALLLDAVFADPAQFVPALRELRYG